ncbi:hypothetical protein NIA71_18775 [Ihubacter massiliensis]|uniref:Uncharacterized protein n=1 Tax=Hominibacterium faecale TaxID=2839743 RepID=A0A9J6QW70_9FIRM|nr:MULTISPECIES: hypothetical protein [Eubacteriales Family XIII. Incertae Sedis]MCO7123974.1 hypothetical protein [Ihubacter massiliensis]MCU7378966.1 hypothetical protein [Hominibacterium faecale]MDY3011272.1 hypothetical protein [Clostridiales Family XIII bacterium]
MVSNERLRVKYYSVNDLSMGFYVNRIEKIICDFVIEAKRMDINEIIELYNIQQFFQNRIYSRYWTKKQLNDYSRIVESFSKVIGKYFSEINIDVLEGIFETINYNYRDDFWKLIEKYKVFERIPVEIFRNITKNKHFILRDVLKCKNLAKKFSHEIITYMEENPFCAEILLSHYLEKHDRDIEPLYFPSELSNDKKILILDNYILSDSANSNYIKLIFESNSTNNLCLPDRLKLRAKRRYDEQMEILFKNSAGFEYGVQVMFSDKQDEEQKFEIGRNRILSVSYSKKWIKENLDYPTLLNNFVYLFGYTDMQFRSLHVLRESQLGILEKTLGIKGKKEYHTGIAFQQMQMLAQLQMVGYCNELEKYHIYLEEIINWFFCNYLKDEFNVKGFNFNVSSRTASYLEKCRNIAAEMDSVLKQFKLWCEDGEIDNELLHISTEHMFIKDIPSMIDNKYIYPCGKDYQTITHLLFSDQSIIYYIPGLSKNYNSFYDLLEKQDVYYDIFQEYQTSSINWLVEHGIIKMDEEKRIIPYKEKINILNELYEQNVACWNYMKKYQDIIVELKEFGMLQFSSSLFSKPEQDYYNYLFNKSEFDNGLDIRNRYSHGTQRVNEEQNKQDYYIFLRIMILIVIKINEEFCLKYPEK